MATNIQSGASIPDITLMENFEWTPINQNEKLCHVMDKSALDEAIEARANGCNALIDHVYNVLPQVRKLSLWNAVGTLSLLTVHYNKFLADRVQEAVRNKMSIGISCGLIFLSVVHYVRASLESTQARWEYVAANRKADLRYSDGVWKVEHPTKDVTQVDREQEVLAQFTKDGKNRYSLVDQTAADEYIRSCEQDCWILNKYLKRVATWALGFSACNVVGAATLIGVHYSRSLANRVHAGKLASGLLVLSVVYYVASYFGKPTPTNSVIQKGHQVGLRKGKQGVWKVCNLRRSRRRGRNDISIANINDLSKEHSPQPSGLHLYRDGSPTKHGRRYNSTMDSSQHENKRRDRDD